MQWYLFANANMVIKQLNYLKCSNTSQMLNVYNPSLSMFLILSFKTFKMLLF